jgi:hypothetical protein
MGREARGLPGRGYLLALARGGPCYALDGTEAGEVTPEHQAEARGGLTLLTKLPLAFADMMRTITR